MAIYDEFLRAAKVYLLVPSTDPSGENISTLWQICKDPLHTTSFKTKICMPGLTFEQHLPNFSKAVTFGYVQVKLQFMTF